MAAVNLLHGTAWGLRGPFMQAIRADYFGRRAIGKIMGISSLIIAIGQIATGFIAIGQMATGVIAIGQVARGFFAVGMLAIGLFSIGMLS